MKPAKAAAVKKAVNDAAAVRWSVNLVADVKNTILQHYGAADVKSTAKMVVEVKSETVRRFVNTTGAMGTSYGP